MRYRRIALFAAPLSLAIVSPFARAYDNSFDYTSFETGFQQAQFDVLNYPSINGNYMMTSTDTHRPEMVANNNALAEFYNNFNADYNHPTAERRTPAAEAAFINTYTLNNSNKNGPRPDWLILNEISSSQWQLNPGVPGLSEHRTWVIDTVTILNDTYGYKVITYSPYETVGTANAASWQALAAKSYIAVESYQSGTEVWNSGSTNAARLAWAQGKYQSSKNTYLTAGVPASKLFVSEHFANNNAITDAGAPAGWGRAGLASAADWDTVIQLRQDAIYNVGFAGFLAYNWGGNGMGVTVAEQIQHEYYYRARLVLASQQPQWLCDNTLNVNGTVIPLSWNQPLNWKGGVPNASGAIANFYRTNTAARTITLDGNKTVGTLTFSSAASYTISPGTGGSVTLSGTGGTTLAVTTGSHTLGVPLVLAGNSSFNIAGTLALNAGFSTSAVSAISRSGAGTLTITGTQSHIAGSLFTASAGTTNFNSTADGNLALTVGAATVNFNVTQNLAALTLNSGAVTKLASGKRVLATSSITPGGGKLDLTDGAFVARSGTLGSNDANHVYNGILGMVQAGRNGGNWNGNGIYTSMTAAKGAAPLTTLATALASEAFGISASTTTTWRGQSVNGNAVLIAYTYAGDADLSGTIDADDYFQINSGYNDAVTTLSYFKGDFNYDGRIDSDDFFIIDANFHNQGAPMTGTAPAGVASVPEPAGMLLSMLAGAVGSFRRRRGSRGRLNISEHS